MMVPDVLLSNWHQDIRQPSCWSALLVNDQQNSPNSSIVRPLGQPPLPVSTRCRLSLPSIADFSIRDSSPQSVQYIWLQNINLVACHYVSWQLVQANNKEYMKVPHLVLCDGIYQWPVDSPKKGPVTRKLYPWHDVIIWIVMLILTHPRMGSAAMARGWSRPSVTMTLWKDPSKVMTAINFRPASVKKRSREMASTAMPSGMEPGESDTV